MVIFRGRSFFRFDICVIFGVDGVGNVIEIILVFLFRRLMVIDITISLFS